MVTSDFFCLDYRIYTNNYHLHFHIYILKNKQQIYKNNYKNFYYILYFKKKRRNLKTPNYGKQN
jgi:hypothetical protein